MTRARIHHPGTEMPAKSSAVPGSASESPFLATQYRRHAQEIFQRCLTFGGGNTAWAEDVTHDVFVRLLECRHELDLSYDVGGWLRTVAYRLCVDRLRRDNRIWNRIRQILIGESAGAHVTQNVAARDDLRDIERIVDLLPARERAVLLMKHIEDLSQREIAAALGYSEGYVSKLCARATRRVKESLP